jgi:hypothetical protein
LNGKYYLSNEEQFKMILNQEEIARIENPEIREIRMKYWALRHNAFTEELNISDRDLEKVCDDLITQEKIDISAFSNRKNLK